MNNRSAKLKIVNDDKHQRGKNTRVYVVLEDGKEIDISHCFLRAEIDIRVEGLVIANLTARVNAEIEAVLADVRLFDPRRLAYREAMPEPATVG